MLNLDLAMEIANEMGWKYPKNSESDVSYVLTTDFMLAVKRDGKLMQVARTVKTTEELDKSSIAARLEIERRYYRAEGIDWSVVTERGIPKLLAENVEWTHSAYWLEATSEMDVDEELRGCLRSPC
jgi:hypothetical protein